MRNKMMDELRPLQGHLNAGVLVHALGDSICLLVPAWAEVVPVVSRRAFPVHHLQGLEAAGQKGGRRETFRGGLQEGA